eukprot:g589.t1
MSTAAARGLPKVGAWELSKKLGSGSFAKVYLGTKINDGDSEAVAGAVARGTPRVVAIKSINSSKLSAKLRSNLEAEIRILRNVKHKHIVALHDIHKSTSHVYLIMEYCAGGDMHQIIRKFAPLSMPTVHTFARQLASGLDFLSAKGYAHRDIKPQNLLICEKVSNEASLRQATLKIADFGFAKHLGAARMAETTCGSPLYMAPEILEQKQYDTKADLWSVGVVLFEMAIGSVPFTGHDRPSLLANILRDSEKIMFPLQISADCQSLITGLLQRDPVERLSVQELCSHRFLESPPTSAEESMNILSDEQSISRGSAISVTAGSPWQARQSEEGALGSSSSRRSRSSSGSGNRSSSGKKDTNENKKIEREMEMRAAQGASRGDSVRRHTIAGETLAHDDYVLVAPISRDHQDANMMQQPLKVDVSSAAQASTRESTDEAASNDGPSILQFEIAALLAHATALGAIGRARWARVRPKASVHCELLVKGEHSGDHVKQVLMDCGIAMGVMLEALDLLRGAQALVQSRDVKSAKEQPLLMDKIEEKVANLGSIVGSCRHALATLTAKWPEIGDKVEIPDIREVLLQDALSLAAQANAMHDLLPSAAGDESRAAVDAAYWMYTDSARVLYALANHPDTQPIQNHILMSQVNAIILRRANIDWTTLEKNMVERIPSALGVRASETGADSGVLYSGSPSDPDGVPEGVCVSLCSAALAASA